MQQPKYIPIQKSKLYRLGRKKDLAELLGISLAEFKDLVLDTNFEEWTKEQKGKGRLIEEPIPRLAVVLSRLHMFISQIETPGWLMSGKKRIKPRDNAEIHRQNPYMITVDIAAFYQSTKREFIYLAFKNIFGQTDDVASLLASLVSYKGHIPTGAATSQLIAFWAYRQTFERLHSLCVANGVTMSVWVDDITFSSSKPFSKSWVSDVQGIVRKVDLSLKTKKTRKYTAIEYKITTGSAISPDGRILVKNEKRKEILDLLKGKRIEALSLKETRTIFGKLVSQRQNEKDFFDSVYFRLKKRLKILEKSAKKSAKKVA